MTQHDDAGTGDEPELDSHALNLLDAFRSEESLPADVSDRVLARLQGSGALEADPVAVTEPDNNRWWAPAIGVALALAATVLLWRADMFAATQDPQRAPVQAGDQAESAVLQRGVAEHAPTAPQASAKRPHPSALAPTPSPAVAPPATLEPETPMGSPPATNRESRAPKRTPQRQQTKPGARTHEPPAPTVAPSSLSEETRALAKAQAAVAAGRYADALRVLASSERRFPAGLMKEERAALRAVALCESDAEDAQRAASAFAKAHPTSALRPRVKNACADN